MSPLTLPTTRIRNPPSNPSSYYYSDFDSGQPRILIQLQSPFQNRTNQKAVIAGVTVAVVIVLSIFVLTVFFARRWARQRRGMATQPASVNGEASRGADGNMTRAMPPGNIQNGPGRRQDTMVNGGTGSEPDTIGRDSESKRAQAADSTRTNRGDHSEEKGSPLPLKISEPRPLSIITGPNSSPLAEKPPTRRNRAKSDVSHTPSTLNVAASKSESPSTQRSGLESWRLRSRRIRRSQTTPKTWKSPLPWLGPSAANSRSQDPARSSSSVGYVVVGVQPATPDSGTAGLPSEDSPRMAEHGHWSPGKLTTKDVTDSPSSVNAARLHSDQRPLPPLPPPPSVPQDLADFTLLLQSYVAEPQLKHFFDTPEDKAFLETIAKNADNLRDKGDPLMQNPANVKRLTRLALYQLVMYCDDSGSMVKQDRYATQKELLKRITSLACKILPPASEGYGIELHFINSESHFSVSPADVNNAVEKVEPSGQTRIGTHLHSKILEPLVYSRLQARERLKRPFLVCCITDGCPYPEPQKTFKAKVSECRKRLAQAGYNPRAVMFCVNQIGSDKDAFKFLQHLREDGEVKDVVHCTSDQLDKKWREFKDNGRLLDEWLLRMLTTPIVIDSD